MTEKREASMQALLGHLSDEVLYGGMPMGYRKDGTPFYAILGAAPDGDEDDPDEDEDDGDGDEDEGDDDDDADLADLDAKAKEKVKEARLESIKRRDALKAQKAELTAAKIKLKEFEDKDKSELDRTKGDAEDYKGRAEKAEESNTRLRVENAFLLSSKQTWHNPQAALRLLDLSEVEIDDDGKIDGLKEAVDKLIKEEPYLLKKDNEDEDEDDSDEEKIKPPAGQGTRRRKSGGKPEQARQKLLDKYPGLARHT